MAEIPRGYVDALTRSLNMLSQATQTVVRTQIEALDYTDVADLRRKVQAILAPVLESATDYAAAYSAQTYDMVSAYSTGEVSGAVAYSGRNPAATDGAVRALVGDVERLGFEAFTQSILDRCDYEIKKAAGDCTLYNAEQDPKKPRFARVPTGFETCTFCLMLASRGFVYRSAETAGAFDHWHPHCDCRVIQGYPGDKIEGYDPDDLYQKWKHQQEHPLKRTRTKENTAAQPVKARQTEKKRGINWDADVYRKLEPSDVDQLSSIVSNAPDSAAKRLYLKWEDKLSLGETTESRAHFSPNKVTVNLDVKRTLSDAKRTPGVTWFHEHGHQIDYLSSGPETYLDKVRRFGSLNTDRVWASTSYENGLFRRTIVDEVSGHVSNRHKLLKERRKELIKDGDIETLYKEGFIDNAQRVSLNRMKESTFKDDAKGLEAVIKDTVKPVPKRRAYQSIEKELRTLTDQQRSDLSDIFEGATNGAIKAGWGHGKSYWKDYENLPCEAFAEFFSAELMNPASLEQLTKWLPESKAVFDAIIAEMEKGNL